MEYGVYELLFFLFCYSFLGWCVEVVYMAVRTGKFCNRGIFNLPLSLSYGLAMDLLIIVLPTLKEAYLLQFLACMIITSVSAQIASEVSRRLTGQSLWEQEMRSVYSGRWRGLFTALALCLLAALVLALIHPVLFLLCQMMPKLLLHIVTLVLSALLAADLVTVLYTVRKRPLAEGVQNLAGELQEQKRNLGSRLSGHIWRRLRKAYPNLRALDEEEDKDRKRMCSQEGSAWTS